MHQSTDYLNLDCSTALYSIRQLELCCFSVCLESLSTFEELLLFAYVHKRKVLACQWAATLVLFTNLLSKRHS